MADAGKEQSDRVNVFGFGEQDPTAVLLALFGLVSVIASVCLYIIFLKDSDQLTALVPAQTSWLFDTPRAMRPDYWTSPTILAWEKLVTYTSACVIGSIGMLMFVAIVLWRRFSGAVVLTVVLISVALSWPLARELTQTGPLRQFIIDRVLLAAEGVGAVLPCTLQRVNAIMEIGSRFGLAAAVATLTAGILLALRGRSDRLDVQSLKDRWQSIFAIYIGAMLIIASMAFSTRLITSYASSTLADGHVGVQVTATGQLNPDPICAAENNTFPLNLLVPSSSIASPSEIRKNYSGQSLKENILIGIGNHIPSGDQKIDRIPDNIAQNAISESSPSNSKLALNTLGDILATCAGVVTGFILFIGCAPSFISIRRDISLAAHAQTSLSPSEWVNSNGLGIGPAKAVLSTAASLAPIFIPTLATIIDKVTSAIGMG